MVKAREQSKTLIYTDPFQIDQITLHEIFLLLQSFILGNFYIRHTCACSSTSVDDFICNSVSVSRTRTQQN